MFYIITMATLYALCWACIDSTHIIKRQYFTNHAPRAAARLLALTGFGMLYGWPGVLLALATFWLVFEFLMNILTDKPLTYQGSTAMLDRLTNWFEGSGLMVRLACMLGSVWTFSAKATPHPGVGKIFEIWG